MRFLLVIIILLAGALLLTARNGHAGGGPPGVWGDGVNGPQALLKKHSDDLSDAKGKSVPAAPLADRPYLFVYYSAGWCPPCHRFTPKLVDFDRQHTGAKRDFDILFVSGDRSPDEQAAYVNEFAMPFAVVDFGSPLLGALQDACRDPGIPNLLLFERSGKLLASSYSGGRYLGPQAALEAYNALPGH